MCVTRIDAAVLHLAIPRPPSLQIAGAAVEPPRPISIRIVELHTDDGLTGLGFGCYPGGGRALLAAIEDELTPLLLGEDPLNHERLWAKARSLDSATANAAYAPIDIALWDLKAK